MRERISNAFERFLEMMAAWPGGPWYKRWPSYPFWAAYFGFVAVVILTHFILDKVRHG